MRGTHETDAVVAMEETWNWIFWVAAFVAAIIAVRGIVRFDVNEWLRDRRKQKEENLWALCPHVQPSYVDGKPAMRSTFMSPSGTLGWQCQACGRFTHDEAWIDQNTEYWLCNPKELTKRIKKRSRLAKKLGQF